jgi:hypothetical protein
MKRFSIVAAVLITCAAALAFTSRAENTNVKGDYVEVRTASVFTGACHFNGEVVTTGREAIMAWNFASGRWNGTEIGGLKAIAVVSADENLENVNAARRSEVILDSAANHEQKVAMLEALENRYAATLGEIVSVRSAPITFNHEGKSYQVASAEAAINVEAMANDLCCRQPNLVWYSPLVQLSGRKVGYTLKAVYSGSAVGDRWERDGENSAFYGSFAF